MSKNIIISKDHWPNISALSKEQAGELLQACISEARGEEPKLSSYAVVNAFEPLRKTIKHKRDRDALNDLWADVVKKEQMRLNIRANTPLKVVR